MAELRYKCFFVMPFQAELHYFYLYLRNHLESRHALHVERGDHAVLTTALLEKIRGQINDRFYEVGFGHAQKKPIVFLTQDRPEDTPVDIRQFEVIPYELSDEASLIRKLDNAIQNLFRTEFDDLYNGALELLRQFNRDNETQHDSANQAEFQARVMRTRRIRPIPEPDDERDYVEFLLPKIMGEATEVSLMKQITDWIDTKFDDASNG